MSRLPARLLGIGLALLKQPLRRRPSARHPVRRILIAHYLLLGDTILLAPLMAKLALAYPEAERFILTRPSVLPLFAAQPWGFRPLAYDPRSFTAFSSLLGQAPFDLAYALGDNRYAWLARALGARWIVGFGDDRPAWKNWILDEAHAFPPSPAALADFTADLVAAPAPLPYQAGDWPVPISEPMDNPAGDHVVLHVGASTSLKLWPPARWQALAEQLQASGLTPVWSAGPGEAGHVEQIDPGGRYRRCCGNLTLAGLWHLLAGARLLVCPDTGVAHLGKIVGTPTVALFGPGSASIYGAGEFWQRAPYRALAAEISCRDQRLLFRRPVNWVRRCGRNHAACAVASNGLPRTAAATACMSAIGLEAVLAACRELLSAPTKPRDAP